MTQRFAWIALALALSACAAPPGTSPRLAAAPAQAPQAIIPFTAAQVEPAAGGAFKITWRAPAAGDVAVYAGTTPQVGRDRLVGRGGVSGAVVAKGLPPAARWYFELVPARGEPLVVADRSLHLKSAPNLRDAGGYRTTDGRWVRVGMIYRSDQLDRLSDADLAVMSQLGLSTVIDLRTDAERGRGHDRVPAGARHVIADVMGPDGPGLRVAVAMASKGEGEAYMQQINRAFVASDASRGAYTLLLSEFTAADAGPNLYHCSAGKDRTGWATAVLLTILGVPRDTVFEDYLASNGYLAEKTRLSLAAGPAPAGAPTAAQMAPIHAVRAPYLAAAFAEADAKYGSFDGYVRQGLGLTDAQIAGLKARYLVGASRG